MRKKQKLPVRVRKETHKFCLMVDEKLFHEANAARGLIEKTWVEIVEEALRGVIDKAREVTK